MFRPGWQLNIWNLNHDTFSSIAHQNRVIPLSNPRISIVPAGAVGDERIRVAQFRTHGNFPKKTLQQAVQPPNHLICLFGINLKNRGVIIFQPPETWNVKHETISPTSYPLSTI
jgi:hypothetical protein